MRNKTGDALQLAIKVGVLGVGFVFSTCIDAFKKELTSATDIQLAI